MKRIFYINPLVGVIGLLLLWDSSAATPVVQLFTLSNRPFEGAELLSKPCYVDQAGRLLAAMNHAQSEGAHRIAKADLKALSQAALCDYQAEQLGVQKLPAIVFDHHYVIYGQVDVMQATRVYQTYREGRYA
tara:strand:- start:147 stop:542 length:396 start_codon:yes stop_codon:yes gene_type:complete